MIEPVPFMPRSPSAFRPERWLDYHVYPAPEGVSVFFRDITEAKTAREELNALTQRLLDLQEEERQRIASELHDSTSQHLVAISLNLMRLGVATGEAAPKSWRRSTARWTRH